MILPVPTRRCADGECNTSRNDHTPKQAAWSQQFSVKLKMYRFRPAASGNFETLEARAQESVKPNRGSGFNPAMIPATPFPGSRKALLLFGSTLSNAI
jgi:hypothetical protein